MPSFACNKILGKPMLDMIHHPCGLVFLIGWFLIGCHELACLQQIAELAGLFKNTVVALNIEVQCNIFCLYSLSLRFWGVQYMGVLN
jgi:hypothetical protein